MDDVFEDDNIGLEVKETKSKPVKEKKKTKKELSEEKRQQLADRLVKAREV